MFHQPAVCWNKLIWVDSSIDFNHGFDNSNHGVDIFGGRHHPNKVGPKTGYNFGYKPL